MSKFIPYMTNVQISFINFDLRFFNIVGHKFHLPHYLLSVALYFTLTANERKNRDDYLEFPGTKTSQKESHLPAKHSQIIKSRYR